MGMPRHCDLSIVVRAHSRVVAWALLVLVALVCAVPANAQTTSGNSGTGNTLWTNKGCGGCHSITAHPINAGNAGGHITYAIAQGMPTSATAGEANDLAAYIGTFLSSSTATVAGNSVNNAIALPQLNLNTMYGKFTAVNVSGASHGTVSIFGTTATYTPTNGYSGTDSFTYQAVVSGG